jgi:hypothetical protein
VESLSSSAGSGTASFNDLSSIVIKGNSGSNTIYSGTSSASIAANGASYQAAHSFTVSGYSGSVNATMPVIQPGGSATVTSASGASVQIGTSSSQILATATLQATVGTVVITVSSSDAQAFTITMAVNGVQTQSTSVTLPQALSRVQSRQSPELLAYAPNYVSDGAPMQIAKVPIDCHAIDWAAGSAAFIAFALSGLALAVPVFGLGLAAAGIFGGLGFGVGAFGVAVWFEGKFTGC